MKHLAALAALPLIAACAQPPASIAAANLGDLYASTPCAAVPAMLVEQRNILAAFEAQQRATVAGDAIGVVLIGLPTSSARGGNVAGRIALTKGRIAALEDRAVNCR